MVMRVVSGIGGSISVPVKAFDNEGEAKRCSEARQGELLSLLSAKLFMPSGKNEISDTGLDLRSVLNSVGITQIGHSILPVEVHGAELAIVTPKLILA